MRLNGTFGLLLSQAALCIVLVASGIDVIRAHGDLSRTIAQQRENDVLAGKIDSQLDSLARGTQELADGGNAHAAAIVATLAQNGVRINARSGKP